MPKCYLHLNHLKLADKSRSSKKARQAGSSGMKCGNSEIGINTMMTRKSRPRPRQHQISKTPVRQSKPSPPDRAQPHLNGRAPIGSRFAQTIFFARNFLKYPNLVGWMLPSSSFVVGQVLSQIDWKRARVIVEYGPGIGTFTGEILKRMSPEARLRALVVNHDFVRFL